MKKGIIEQTFETESIHRVQAIWNDPVAKSLLTHLPPGPNDRKFADDIFRRIFVNENFSIFT